MKVKDIKNDIKIGDEIYVKAKVAEVDFKCSFYQMEVLFEGTRASLKDHVDVYMDEPQTKKVEVPSCMGEFLDHYDNKEDVSMHIIMKDFTRSDYFSSFCKLNFQDYPMGWDKLMASALMYGYTVKPKRWVVKSPELYGMYFRGIAGVSTDGECSCQWNEPKGCVKFTDKAKAEAVATLVDGSVEEV